MKTFHIVIILLIVILLFLVWFVLSIFINPFCSFNFVVKGFNTTVLFSWKLLVTPPVFLAAAELQACFWNFDVGTFGFFRFWLQFLFRSFSRKHAELCSSKWGVRRQMTPALSPAKLWMVWNRAKFGFLKTVVLSVQTYSFSANMQGGSRGAPRAGNAGGKFAFADCRLRCWQV